jgi:hypothetical protein
MTDNIFVKKGMFPSLEEFARFVFTLLKFGNVKEHHSANYWGEQYFSADSGNASLSIAGQDDPGFEDYDYWISVQITNANQAEETELGKEFARILAQNGFDAARPYSKEDWLYSKPVIRRIVYRKKRVTEGDVMDSVAPIEETVEEVPRQKSP